MVDQTLRENSRFSTTKLPLRGKCRISSQVEKQTVRNVTQMMALKRMVESGMFASHIRHSAEYSMIWGFPKMLVPNKHGFSY